MIDIDIDMNTPEIDHEYFAWEYLESTSNYNYEFMHMECVNKTISDVDFMTFPNVVFKAVSYDGGGHTENLLKFADISYVGTSQTKYEFYDLISILKILVDTGCFDVTRIDTHDDDNDDDITIFEFTRKQNEA